MAKATLTERFVQNAVAEQLNRQYYRRKPAYVVTEAYTRLKRADVFLAFMRTHKRPYVVVVEAKSRTTIHQLTLRDDPDKLRWAGRLITIGLIAGLSAVLGYQWYFNALNTVLLLALFLLGAGLITKAIALLELSALRSVGAIEQLGRYPANEQWIAIAEDAFAKPAQYRALRRQCRKNRVGLIVVTAAGKLLLREIPMPRHTFNNYLGSYGKQSDILKIIEKNARYGPTPPERRKTRRQLLNALVMVSTVSIMGAIAYEENVRPVVPDPFAAAIFTDSIKVDTADVAAIDSTRAVTWAPDCTGLQVSRRGFIVVDALLSEENANRRLAKLSAAGIVFVRAIPTECLHSWPAPGRLAIWTGEVFPDRPAANAAAHRYQQQLLAAGLESAYGKAVKVRAGGSSAVPSE
ncbi:hypothetical protein QWY85_04750 [Neolewinella lacunae]|uniref:Uncharacterized protein n=1 Tax=Neolewinella lacunae TaxID=1517758 RepID=A0A923TAF1_9BACT|nr:hypothetical protein [Neolewinella lacunae]MBC6996103.1 hypothetical protein [Neolewinella lacunae]MDN3633957.1 hypothetical protein [Neolewinella lacunae]